MRSMLNCRKIYNMTIQTLCHVRLGIDTVRTKCNRPIVENRPNEAGLPFLMLTAPFVMLDLHVRLRNCRRSSCGSGALTNIHLLRGIRSLSSPRVQLRRLGAEFIFGPSRHPVPLANDL